MDGTDLPIDAADEIAHDARRFHVAVRTLCEFAAKTGDLDLRFTPSPTAQQGTDGHQTVQSRRTASYCREVSVEGTYKTLTLRGRVDGFDPERRRLEEIKTCIGTLDDIPRNQQTLHWAQAKIYAALLCRRFDLSEIEVALVYFNIREQAELPHLVERHCAPELEAFLNEICERFLRWATLEAAHRAQRNLDLEKLPFPQPTFRRGQRELAKAVFNAARGGHCLMAQAPTGIGKTLAALFPMLKAVPRTGIDKIYFLTAKGSGRTVALDTIRTLSQGNPSLALRTLELTARNKACEHPDKACHGDACPLAKGFYDRLAAARAEATERSFLTREVVREVALNHGVCPYFLGQEMVRWCDVVIADYNHYFDRSALLYALSLDNEWRVALLVDEAHNLVDRAREMYTASLASSRLRSSARKAPSHLAAAFTRVRRPWSRLVRDAPSAYSELPAVPRPMATSIHDLNAALSEHFAQFPLQGGGELLDFYFDALAFERTLTDCDDHSMIDLACNPAKTMRQADSVITIRNVVPATLLAPRFAAATACVLFSATLTPWPFYTKLLGLPEKTHCVDIPSPFDAAQLDIRVIDRLSTRLRDRDDSIEPIVHIVRLQIERKPGNYLVFLSSHDYLERVAERFANSCPAVRIWRQSRQMSDRDREAFLREFAPEGAGVGFAVLGGVFAEGVDLAGTRLVGAFIATLGLPQVNEVNEAMRRRVDRHLGNGYDYTYLYPGLRKVVQAAGRVIRTPTDRGSVYLIDDRYGRADVRRLLPAWWRIKTESDTYMGVEIRTDASE